MGRLKLSKKISLIVAATLVASNFVLANGAKNCITDLKLNSDGKNVKVDIYTDKPYSEPVVVNKKEGNRYVILIPETSSSVKSAPKVVGGSNLSVNMQTVTAGKGYTKITIVSDKAVNIIPKTITYTPPVQVVPVQKQEQQVVKPVVKTPLETQTKVVQKQPVKQAVSTSKPSAPKANVVKSVAKSQPIPPKPVVKPTVVSQPVETPIVKPVQDVNKPFTILENEVKTDKVSDVKVDASNELLQKTIEENERIIKERKLEKLRKKGKKLRTPIDDRKLSPKEMIGLVIDELQTLSLWKLLMLAGAITFPIVVIMIILNLDKRVNRRIKAMRKEEDISSVERALRENIAAVRAQKEAQANSEAQSVDTVSSVQSVVQYPEHVEEPQSSLVAEHIASQEQFNSFDDMLDKVDNTPSFSQAYSDTVQNVVPVVEEEFEPIDASDFIIEPSVPEVVSEAEVNNAFNLMQAEVADSRYYNKSVSLEEFMSNKAPVKEPAPLIPYNPDGVLADFSNVSDKEFFDELVLQSFAESCVDKLPDNLPEDEVFNSLTDSDFGVMLSDFGHENFEQESDISNEPYVADESDVTMQKEAKIDDNTSLYLVNCDNVSSLVGNIEGEYFVLKTFDKIVNGEITLKPTEKTEDFERYLVRVGRNKMIVEVKDKAMSRLIDL